jgi:hypothetical protein
MTYLDKVTANSDSVSLLIRALYRTVGNKVFMRGIEDLLQARLKDLTPGESVDIQHLARALGSLEDSPKARPW